MPSHTVGDRKDMMVFQTEVAVLILSSSLPSIGLTHCTDQNEGRCIGGFIDRCVVVIDDRNGTRLIRCIAEILLLALVDFVIVSVRRSISDAWGRAHHLRGGDQGYEGNVVFKFVIVTVGSLHFGRTLILV